MATAWCMMTPCFHDEIYALYEIDIDETLLYALQEGPLATRHLSRWTAVGYSRTCWRTCTLAISILPRR